MDSFLDGLKAETNFTLTENGAVTHKSSLNALLDLFSLGGAYRSRSDADCIALFKKAFDVYETSALRCLFYLRDARRGQGERRFFRVCMKWLANEHPDAASRNLSYIPELGRWDDLYTFVDTPLEEDAFDMMYDQLQLDINCKTPSLLAKWLKSENASSAETRKLGTKTRKAFGMTSRQYRKTLSILRERIKVVERLMSAGRWQEIEFDKIPSRAGLIYRNAFARKDLIKEKYERFIKDKHTKVNADVLYPLDIANNAFKMAYYNFCDPVGVINKVAPKAPERVALQKYWNNLPNYYRGREENGIAVVDVSGSMLGTPLKAAVSMGAYIAEKAHGPFAGYFITFSNAPELVEFKGIDIVDKFVRASSADWGQSTNIEAVFNLLLNTALREDIDAKDMPSRIYIFSDMEFNHCMAPPPSGTLLEYIADKWSMYGYKLPDVIFWNLAARHDNIPAIGPGFSYVSGFSPVMVDAILSGKDGVDLMLEKINSDRYSCIV